jgi:hypothetical protein
VLMILYIGVGVPVMHRYRSATDVQE